jgi:carbon storage regulator
MLLIRRRPQESILIGDSIEIQVLEISRGQVKLGVVAPTEVPILRKEILLTETENRAASRSISGPNLEALVQAFRR